MANPVEAPLVGCPAGHETLKGVQDLALTSDQRQLYAVAESDSGMVDTASLVGYSRDPATGELTRIACRSRTASLGCVVDARLVEPAALVIAPGDADVYVADATGRLHHYRRAADGALTFQSCHEPLPDDDVQCTFTSKALGAPSGLALSPDGNHLYVTSYNSNAVVVFSRNASTGALTFVECEASPDTAPADPNHCGSGPSGSSLAQAEDVVATASGRHVYVGARGNSVVGFVRDAADGRLSAPQVLSSDDYLQGVQTLVVTPGGDTVYAGLFDGTGLTTLSLDPATGAPSLLGCLRQSASASCAASPGVDAVFGLAFSADNRLLYAAARNGSSIASFRRGPSGALTLVDCAHASTFPTGDCPRTTNGTEAAVPVIATSDGRFVYVGGDSAIATFRPEYAPSCAPLGRSVPNGRATLLQLSCSDPEGLAVTYALSSQPAHGTARLLDAATGQVRYVPAPGFGGKDEFAFSASDGTNASAPAIASLTVPVDDIRPRMRIVTRRIRLTRKGRAVVTVACLAGEPAGCRGRLSGRSAKRVPLGPSRVASGSARRRFVRLGARAFRIGEGRRRRVSIRVTRRARVLVASQGRLVVRLTAQARDPSGNVGRTARRVVVLPPRRR